MQAKSKMAGAVLNQFFPDPHVLLDTHVSTRYMIAPRFGGCRLAALPSLFRLATCLPDWSAAQLEPHKAGVW